MSNARHATVRRMRAIGQYVIGCSAGIAECVQRRMSRMRGGSYLLVDSDRYVYLIRSESIVSEEIVNGHPGLLVGMYRAASVDQIIEDIETHLQGLKIGQIVLNCSCLPLDEETP